MTTQMHLAAQYLAAAGNSFLEKKEDDSHTNLGFSIEERSLSTHPLNDNGDILSLNYNRFTLEWNTKNSKSSLRLNQTTHAEILKWIQQTAEEANIHKSYKYNLHYKLPYNPVTGHFEFKLNDVKRLHELADFRTLGQRTLEIFLENQQLKSDIRIWPHHFDTGAFIELENDPGISVRLGLAIPDKIIRDYYFYISGYRGHDSIDPSGFSSLTNGKWYTRGFKGAVLPVSKINQNDGVTFFNEALAAYMI